MPAHRKPFMNSCAFDLHAHVSDSLHGCGGNKSACREEVRYTAL